MLPNIWLPEGVLPGFKEACLDFFWVSASEVTTGILLTPFMFIQTYRKVELNTLRALALGFHLPEDYLVNYHATGENQLRLLRYPRLVGLWLWPTGELTYRKACLLDNFKTTKSHV